MTDTSGTGAIGTVFPDKASAERCVARLKESGFEQPWMAVVTGEGGTLEHAVAETNDGALGALGRYFSGRHLLGPLLAEHGLPEEEAVKLDASVAPNGAVVVVVAAGARADAAREILRGGAERLVEPGDARAGQGDELDRGSGAGASGGGLGATTGFMSERAARKDLRDNEIGEL